MSFHPAFYVYIMERSDGGLYTGYTENLGVRIKEHNGELIGGAKYTKSHRPAQLVYSEGCISREEAKKRESEIKRLSRLKKQELISAHHNPDDI